MRNKTLWKGFSAAMAVMTSVCSVSAADFTDGTLYETVAEADEAEEANEATEADEVKENGKIEESENTLDLENAGFAELTDSSGLFDDGTQPSFETPELTDSNITSAFSLDPTPGDYQASITGKLYLSETEEFVRLINIERKKLGLGEVKIDQEMMDIASRRAMEASVYYDHHSPNGANPSCSEVISPQPDGYTAKEYVDSWKGTAAWEKPISHWDILMTADYTRIGFAFFGQERLFTGLDNPLNYGVATLGYPSASEKAYEGGYMNKVLTRTIDISSNCVRPIHGETKGAGGGTHNQERRLFPKETILLAPMLGKRIPSGEFAGYFCYLDNSSGTWESLNPAVAAVDSNGMVTGVSTGTAEIRFYLNNGGGRYYSRMVKVTKPVQTKKPGVPKLKGGVNKQTCVWLDWMDVPDARGYQLYRYDGSKKKYVRIKEYSPTGLYNFSEDCGYGKTEKFKVRAFNDGDTGRTYGDFSNVITVKTASPETKIFKLTAGKGSVSLTWKKAAGAEYYQIYRAASKNGTYSKIKTVKGNVLTYKNTGLKKGKSYYYKVRAYRVGADGKKIYSKFSPVIGKKTK